MTRPLVSDANIAAHYQVLEKIGCLGDDRSAGYLRAAYSAEETAAMEYIEHCAVSAGAKASWDAVGNLSLSWPGKTDAYVEAGSHLDTVPMGGNFDGAAGVVAGLAAMTALSANYGQLEAGLRLRVWRCEESSTYNSALSGSQAAFGILKPSVLSNRFRGQSLADAMLSQSADPSYIEKGLRTISQTELDSIRAHIELHIEQGNFLEVQNLDIGVVTSIRGTRRFRVALRGEFDHSGATPMGVEYRRDANLALAHILVEMNRFCLEAKQGGADLVQTCGVINSNRDFNESLPGVYQNAIPKVSGFCYFCFDARSSDNTFIVDYCERITALIKKVAAEFRVDAEIEALGSLQALESTSAGIQDVSMAAAEALGISAARMPSGALHDAAILGAQKQTAGGTVPVGMLFIPCLKGKSHDPAEFATNSAIAKGACVLAEALSRLARQ